jgi:capsular exopolysaccharide synthesis family protein
MEPVDYVRGIRRRWKVVLASVIVALVIGLLFSRGGTTASSRTRPSYRATTYLVPSTSTADVGRAPSNLPQIATLATLGEVPGRVADALPFDVDPSQLARVVTVNPDEATGLLGIAATDPSASRARIIANTYARELQGFLRDRTLDQAKAIQDQIDRLDRKIAALSGSQGDAGDTGGGGNKGGGAVTPVGGSADASNAGELQTLEFQRNFLAQQYSQLVASAGGDASGFEILEPAQVAVVVPDRSGIQAPRSRWVRLMIAGGIGLLFGLGLALILERLDTKVRSRDQAEELLRLPVLGEIPSVPYREKGSIVIESSPSAPAANAFRFLASALQFGRYEGLAPMEAQNGHRQAKTILVTSSTAGEGKSAIVANLAVAFAELGKRVVVMCCDFRHPTAHLAFGVQEGPGLTEALDGERAGVETLLQPTRLEFVRVLSTGDLPYRAGVFGSEKTTRVLQDLRATADVVLIDTSPILAESDWTQMLPDIDAVLLVVRAGKTESATAQRSAEMLSILQAPVVGVALNGLPPSSVKGTGSRYRTGNGRGRESESTPSDTSQTEDDGRESESTSSDTSRHEGAGSHGGNGGSGKRTGDQSHVGGVGDSA